MQQPGISIFFLFLFIFFCKSSWKAGNIHIQEQNSPNLPKICISLGLEKMRLYDGIAFEKWNFYLTTKYTFNVLSSETIWEEIFHLNEISIKIYCYLATIHCYHKSVKSIMCYNLFHILV